MGSTVSRGADNEDCGPLGDIPEELIKAEIVSRLPVISLMRFRCVCKSWKRLLSGDPNFVQSHLTNYSMNLNNGSLIARSFPFVNPNIIHPLNSGYVDFGGSVHGLVCVHSYNLKKRSIDYVGLWNPATNHYKDIPIPPCSANARIPGMDNFSFGIGFDPIANDYKIIYITQNRARPLLASVYSCHSDSWGINTIKSTFVQQGYHFPCPTVVHGRPYWYNMDIVCGCGEEFYVMFFDFQDETFRLLPGIDFYNQDTQARVMVNFRDSLAFLVTDMTHKTTSRSVDVYVFDEKSQLWTKNYTIGPITIPKYMVLLHCFRNGDLLFYCCKYIKLVGINPQTHAINRFASGMYRYDSSSRINLVFAYGCGYIESLVSVKGMSSLHVPKVATDILVIEKCF